jgi:hypothetical protein
LNLSFSYSNPRRGGFPTPRAQFINNGFGLGEFLDKRRCVVGIKIALFDMKRDEELAESVGLGKPDESIS